MSRSVLPESLRKVLSPLLLMAGAFLLYANTFGNAWTYDDFPVIVHNPDVRSLAGFLADSYPGRPLREVTYLVDHALFGMNPAGWHIQNIFWHGLGAVLLYPLARRLGAGAWGSWGAALLFLAHPLQVEVVANVSHRKDSLALVFSLLALHAWMSAFAPGRRRAGWVAASVLLAAVAFAAKETAVVLPPLFWGYERLFVPPERRLLARSPRLAWGLMGVGAAACVLWLLRFGGAALYARGTVGLLRLRSGYEGEIAPEVYVRTVLKGWGFLFGKIVLPADLALEYAFPVPGSWLDLHILPAIGVAAVSLIFLARGRRHPRAAFALLWAALFFLPVSNLWPLAYFAADRYLYAPLAGLALLAGFGLDRLARRRPAPAGAALLLAAGVLSLLTWQQNRVWATPLSLWSQAVAVSPSASFALNNLGWLHLEAGEEGRALELLERAARNRWNPNPQDNLAWLYERRGERSKALAYYLRFLTAAGDGPAYRERAARVRAHLQQSYGVHLD